MRWSRKAATRAGPSSVDPSSTMMSASKPADCWRTEFTARSTCGPLLYSGITTVTPPGILLRCSIIQVLPVLGGNLRRHGPNGNVDYSCCGAIITYRACGQTVGRELCPALFPEPIAATTGAIGSPRSQLCRVEHPRNQHRAVCYRMIFIKMGSISPFL